MGVFSEEENPWNGGQFESDFQAWEYFIVGSGLPGFKTRWHCANLFQPIKGFHFLRLYHIQ